MVGLKPGLEAKIYHLDLPANMQDLHGLTLMEAIKAHAAWIDKLERTLRGTNPEEYDIAIVSADHLCALGKWLYGDGKALANHREYDGLLAAHAQFHACAGSVIEKHKKGQFLDAITALRKDLVRLSGEVQISLVQLLKASLG